MRFRASLAFGLAAIALLVPTSGVPQRSHAPRGRVVLTLGVPGQPIRLGDKPLLDVRIENVGTTRISFFGEFWYDENLRCSLTRDGVPQKRSPRMAANRIRPNMSNLVTLVPGAYFGRYVRFGDDMFGFALEKTGHYALACDFTDLVSMTELLHATQMMCNWPKADASRCAHELMTSPYAEGVGTIKARVAFDVLPR